MDNPKKEMLLNAKMYPTTGSTYLGAQMVIDGFNDDLSLQITTRDKSSTSTSKNNSIDSTPSQITARDKSSSSILKNNGIDYNTPTRSAMKIKGILKQPSVDIEDKNMHNDCKENLSKPSLKTFAPRNENAAPEKIPGKSPRGIKKTVSFAEHHQQQLLKYSHNDTHPVAASVDPVKAARHEADRLIYKQVFLLL